MFIDGFDHQTFITENIGIPVYAVIYLGYKWWHETKIIKPEEADLVTFKHYVDAEEEARIIKDQERKERTKLSSKKYKEWFYDKFVP